MNPTGRKVIILSLLGVGIVALIAFVGTKALPVFDHARAYEEARADAKRAGIPLSIEEARPQPPIAREDNAGPLLRPILDQLQGSSKETNQIKELISAGKFSEALAVHPELFELLEASKPGLAKPRLDFDRDYNLGLDLKFPEFASIKRLSHLSVGRAQIAAGQNDPDRALEYLRIGHKIEKLLRDEYTLIGYLMNLATHRTANRGYRRVASMWRGDEARLTRISQTFDPPEPPSLERALKTEAFVNQTSLRVAFRVGDPRANAKEVRVAQRAMAIYYTEAIRDLESIENSGGDPLVATREMEARTASFKSSVIPDPAIELFKIIRPTLDRLGIAAVEATADRVVTEAFLKVMLYEARTNRWPESLDQAGVTALDPFTKQPVRYRLEKNGFRIWSVGGDSDDDNGLTREEITQASRPSPTPEQERGDNVARYPTPL